MVYVYNNVYDANILATKGNTLKEEWIAYIAREILRVSTESCVPTCMNNI